MYGDITDEDYINSIFRKYKFDSVIHLAAESHVDRSISEPLVFARTNILGTIILLNAFKDTHKNISSANRFFHVSTDEVYGTLDEKGLFTENSPYSPNSPYSASKASSDHFVRAYAKTYKIPYIISNCSNNYGPNQFPEKLIPLFINNIINKIPIPIYGDGKNIRDWIYVLDHADAIDVLFHEGKDFETYNIGGFNEISNIDLAILICDKIDKKFTEVCGNSQNIIKFVKDRPGHDLRYALDASKIKYDIGWKPSVDFDMGLDKTIDWYINNKEWINNVLNGNHNEEYKTNNIILNK